MKLKYVCKTATLLTLTIMMIWIAAIQNAQVKPVAALSPQIIGGQTGTTTNGPSSQFIQSWFTPEVNMTVTEIGVSLAGLPYGPAQTRLMLYGPIPQYLT